MSLIWLVRHGAAQVDPGLAVGSIDVPLSPDGEDQARRLAAGLAPRLIGRVVSSDLQRARRTAEAIADPHGLAVEVVPALREIDFGIWEGRALEGLWRESPDEARAWETNLRATPSTFGESFGSLEDRVLEFWSGLRRSCGETVLVSHRGPLLVLLMAVTGMPVEKAWRWKCSTGTGMAC